MGASVCINVVGIGGGLSSCAVGFVFERVPILGFSILLGLASMEML